MYKKLSPVAGTSINFFSQVRLKRLPGVASLLLGWALVCLVRETPENISHTLLKYLFI
jgi:hypothetical protein